MELVPLNKLKIPRERILVILEKVIAERDDPGNDLCPGGIQLVVQEIAQNTGRTEDGIARAIWRIRSGWDSYTARPPKNFHQPATDQQLEKLRRAGFAEDALEGLTAGEAHDLIVEHVKRVPYTHCGFDLAETLLLGLGLEHLWHTDLADLYFGAAA